MYITPMIQIQNQSTGDQIKYTKGWNGVIFVHSGPYEQGVFKFRIDFTLKYPLHLPAVLFKSRQVYHPFVKFETGSLDV